MIENFVVVVTNVGAGKDIGGGSKTEDFPTPVPPRKMVYSAFALLFDVLL